MSDQPARCPEHVSWCTGQHDQNGECQHLVRDPNNNAVELLAVPCSHVNLSFDGLITEVAELDWLLAELGKARAMLESGIRESICTHD